MTRIRRSSLRYRFALPFLAVDIVVILMIGLSVQRTFADSAGFALEFNGTDDHARLGDTGDLFDNPAWVDTNSISVWVNPTGPTSMPTHPIEPPTPTPTSVPGNPEEVESYEPPDNIFEVTVSGDIVYITENGLHVLDITAPSNPVEIGFLDTPDQALDIALSGATAYLADYRGGLRVIDVADPTNPQELGSFSGAAGCRSGEFGKGPNKPILYF